MNLINLELVVRGKPTLIATFAAVEFLCLGFLISVHMPATIGRLAA